jgi:hypothetical protein
VLDQFLCHLAKGRESALFVICLPEFGKYFPLYHKIYKSPVHIMTMSQLVSSFFGQRKIMARSPGQAMILTIGNDDRLAYLLARYAEQSNCQVIQRSFAPWIGEVRQLRPSAIIFLSLELLQAAQTLIEDLSANEILVLTCVAVADEVRAREYGADTCLVHPLMYADFQAALASVCSAGEN